VDWTEVDDSLDNRPAGFGDEAFLKNIQESFDGALLMVSTGEETRLLIHGSDDYPQTDNVEDLGMTPEMIARRSAFSDVGGVSSLCVYSDLGRDGASLIYVKPLRALFMRCMPHVIMVELSALIIIITLCHYLLTVFRYIDGHRLTKEQARRYHPKQLRRTVVAAGLTGALIIFVSTALPGKTVMEYGLPEKSLADGYTDFATLRGVQSYVTTVRQSDVFFIYIIKNSMLFSNTLPASLAATLAYLVVLSVVLVICLRKYDENAFGKCTFEDGQNPGDAGAQATGEAPEESYGLSELAVNRGRKKVPKEDRTPESRVKSVIKFDIILLIRLPALFSLRDGGTSIGNGTLLQFLMNGDWNRGFNLFALCSIIIVLITGVMLILLSNGVLSLIAGFTGKGGETFCRLLYSLVNYIGVLGALYYLFDYIGLPISTYIASLSVVSLALSLGAKDMVSDILAGLLIVFEGQFQVGDIVEIDDVQGEVLEIGVRSTRLLNINNDINYFTNSAIRRIVNKSKRNSSYVMDLTVLSQDSLEAVEALFERELPGIGRKHNTIISGPRLAEINIQSSFGHAQNEKLYKIVITAVCRAEDVFDVGGFVKRKVYLLCEREDIMLWE